MMAWLALREGQAADDVVEVEPQTEPRSASGVESNPVQAEPGAAPERRGISAQCHSAVESCTLRSPAMDRRVEEELIGVAHAVGPGHGHKRP